MPKKEGIIGFIKNNCANYDIHYGGCLFAKTCKAIDKTRCSYLEQKVLPAKPEMLDVYMKHIGQVIALKIKSVRYCGCGEHIKPRQRMCKKCSEKRRKDTYRKTRDKKAKLLLDKRNS